MMSFIFQDKNVKVTGFLDIRISVGTAKRMTSHTCELKIIQNYCSSILSLSRHFQINFLEMEMCFGDEHTHHV